MLQCSRCTAASVISEPNKPPPDKKNVLKSLKFRSYQLADGKLPPPTVKFFLQNKFKSLRSWVDANPGLAPADFQSQNPPAIRRCLPALPADFYSENPVKKPATPAPAPALRQSYFRKQIFVCYYPKLKRFKCSYLSVSFKNMNFCNFF